MPYRTQIVLDPCFITSNARHHVPQKCNGLIGVGVDRRRDLGALAIIIIPESPALAVLGTLVKALRPELALFLL